LIFNHNSHDASLDPCPGERSQVSRQSFTIRGITVRKVLICALALGGFAASAQAADLGLDSMKDALPEGPLTWHGVTIYGTIDVGGAYDNHSAPLSNSLYVGVPTSMWSAPYNNRSISSLTENGLEQSKIGVKVEENIGYGFTAIGKLETGFNPLSGEIADACKSIFENGTRPITSQSVNGDGSRCGQAFNGPAYAGVSNASYGTLTFGRQQSLELDAESAYDPIPGGGYAFSWLNYTATGANGDGVTGDARWDNSVKYVYQYGPVHAAGMYANGGEGTDLFGYGVGANAGFSWKGLSVDGVYTKENGAATFANGDTYQTTQFTQPVVGGTVTNNEMWSVMGKYSFDVPGLFGYAGLKDGCGLKDECETAKLTFFGGYAHIELTDASPVATGTSGLGGYTPMGYSSPGVYGVAAWNNTPFAPGTSKIAETEWVGARYETGPWTLATAYYHYSQDNYLLHGTFFDAGGAKDPSSNATCAQITTSNQALKKGLVTTLANGAGATGYTQSFIGNTEGKNCAGDLNQASFVVDYAFTKHFDVYGGVTWSETTGGLNSGFLQSDNVGVVSGLRLKF